MELLSSLVSLGLTEYEAKVYLALLKGSPANGYQLSKRTGVPRSMIYEALGRLHTRGAVLKSGDERSTLYRPVPPDDLLDRYKRENEQLIDNSREQLLSQMMETVFVKSKLPKTLNHQSIFLGFHTRLAFVIFPMNFSRL